MTTEKLQIRIISIGEHFGEEYFFAKWDHEDGVSSYITFRFPGKYWAAKESARLLETPLSELDFVDENGESIEF